MPSNNTVLTLSRGQKTLIGLFLLALVCSYFADLSISTRTPWHEFGLMAKGLLEPQWPTLTTIITALLQTVCFALVAVSAAAIAGFLLSLFFHHRLVRAFCSFIRAVHELFWGLLFIQVIGMHPLTGLLAIAIPFSGVFAKVFAEILQENPSPAARGDYTQQPLSHFFYCQWPLVKNHFANYSLYRLECGLRSSTILGFIGLPTLGFYLESSFMQGYYQQVAGLLIILYALIASLRYWFYWRLLPLYVIVSLFYLSTDNVIHWSLSAELLHDMIPAPFRQDDIALLPWLNKLWIEQIIPGTVNTLLLTQIALVLSGLIALLSFPVISTHFSRRPYLQLGHGILVVLRSTPELMIAFILLLLWGPSMLPGVIALAIHNGAIIAHLLGRYSNQIHCRLDSSQGFNRYSYEIVPRLYGQFLAFLFYRWEVIMRESAILGILGIQTLGFYIDSAFESFRLDIAMILIMVSALLNIGVDETSRKLRLFLHISSSPQTRTPC